MSTLSIKEKFSLYQKELSKILDKEVEKEDFFDELRQMREKESSLLDLYDFVKKSPKRKKFASSLSLNDLSNILTSERRTPEQLVAFCTSQIDIDNIKVKPIIRKKKKTKIQEHVLECLKQGPCSVGEIAQTINREKSHVGSSLYHLIKNDKVQKTGSNFELVSKGMKNG
jgi:hypothetical protein